MAQKKSRGAESSALQNEKVFVLVGQENDTIPASALQEFSSCVPCASCAYFRAVPLDSGRVRRVCQFTGERLTLAGNPLCEMQGGCDE